MAQLFSCNVDLYSYLGRLRQMLADRGANDLADVVGKSLRFAAGTTTEFLGESRIALSTVQHAKNNPLDQSERQLLAQAVAELNAAFDRR